MDQGDGLRLEVRRQALVSAQIDFIIAGVPSSSSRNLEMMKGFLAGGRYEDVSSAAHIHITAN